MATTTRFGLQSFGGRVPGSFRDDGYAYTLADRQVIDALLAALESHTHGGGERLLDPGPPTITTTVDPAGNLVGGRTYYYKVGYLDRWGLETAASEEVSITLPPGPPTPSPPTPVVGTGGSLKSGSYYYAVTAYVGDESRQTLASQTIYVTLTGTQNKITLTFPAADPSADGWVVYRKGPGETMLYCLASVPKSSTTYIDNGSVISDCTKTPPTTDTTATDNKVTVSIDVGDQEPVSLAVTALVFGGGSLAAGTYNYRVRPSVVLSGTTYYGDVTDVAVTVPLASSTVELTVVYSGGEFAGTTPPAISVEVFGRTTVSYKLLFTGTIAGGETTEVLTDDGSLAGGATYAPITVNWIAPPIEVSSWRIYRTNTSGNYPSGSLVHHVVETEAADSGGNLILSWDDIGNPLLAGAPRSRSSTFQPPAALSLDTHAETCLYTPPAGSPFPGPTVAAALDEISDLLGMKWTKTYTFLSGVGPITGFARFYPGTEFKVLGVRAALSHTLTASYTVKVNGTALWGSPQLVTAAGITQAAAVADVVRPATDYLTVDLVSGTIAAGQALVIHVDLANV